LDDCRPGCVGARDRTGRPSAQRRGRRPSCPCHAGRSGPPLRLFYRSSHPQRSLQARGTSGWTLTPDHIKRFVEELRVRVGSVTTAQTIHKLRRAAQLLDPNRDFTWLAEIEKDFAVMMRPQSKDHRIVDPDRLFEAGLALIDEATAIPDLTPLRRARQVRNGLMVALLVLCPIRLKN